MKLLKVISLFLILLYPAIAFSLDEAKFQNLIASIRNKEYGPVKKFLNDNKQKLSRDPEYYVILLNYVSFKGHESLNVIAAGTPTEGDLELRDVDNGEVIGFVGSRERYDEALIVDGIKRTQTAQKYFRSRLDIYFGIVGIAERIQRWDIVGEELVAILETSRKIDNKWTWGSINSMEGDPEEFMIQNILPRTYSLFHAETPEADEVLMKVSQAMIMHYPKKIYGYANLGALYLAKNDYDSAEKYFRQALNVDPKDEVVLANLEELKRLRK